MTERKLKIVPPSKTVQEVAEDIQLPLFDIIVNNEGNWFTEALEAIEESNDSTKH